LEKKQTIKEEDPIMGGKCGGPSLKERALNHQIHAARLAALSKLKPPYDCPKCSSAKSVGVKVEVINNDRTFIFRCSRCGLKESIVLNGNAFTSLDAYNKLIDKIYVKPIVQ
jgi:transcription elongation factor Elf1